MYIFYPCVRYAFKHYGARYAAVGVVVVGCVERTVNAKGVVHFNLYFMPACCDIFYYCRKRRKGVVVVRDFLAVKIYIRRVAHALKFKADISAVFNINLACICSLAAVC